MMKRVRLVLLAVTGAAMGLGPPPAQAADPGRTVLSFLKLGVGARATSLGEAYVSVVEDATATYWNPAGLLGVERNDVVASHHAWIQDLRHEFVSFAAHRGRHAAGVSFIGLYTDDIQGRDVTGAATSHFGYSNNSFSASYAFQATATIGVGGTARYVRESVVGTDDGDFTLSGMAFDFGANWVTPFTGVTAGAIVRDVGGELSYDFDGAESFQLPTALQAGVSYRRADLHGGRLIVSADFLGARGDDASFRMGAEYAYQGQFLVGAGYKTGLDNEDVSFGVGYDNRVRVHYAFAPVANDLGSSHRISVGYGW